jgi:hypothetical protein
MQSNKNWIFIAIFGLLFGFILGYIYTKTSIDKLNEDIRLLENQLNEKNTQLTNIVSEIDKLNQEIQKVESDYEGIKINFELLSQDYELLTLENNEIKSEYEILLNKYNESKYSDEYEIKYEELYEKYLSLLEMSSKYGYSINEPYENLLEYIEIDQNNEVTITENRVNWKKMSRYSNSEVWRNYNDSSEYFIHQFLFCITEIDPGDSDYREMITLWKLSSENNILTLSARQDGSSSDKYYVNLQQIVNTNKLIDYKSEDHYDPLSTEHQYIARITRTKNKFRIEILNASNGATLIDSGLQDGSTTNFDKLALASIGRFSSDLTDWSSGYIENVKIFN